MPSDDWFNALTQLTPATWPGGGQIGGDVIAVGRTTKADGNGTQGWIVRVDGNTGAWSGLAPLVQGAGEYGRCASPCPTCPLQCGEEEFFSVEELSGPTGQVGPLGYPNVVVAGQTTTPAFNADIYVLKLNDGNPSSPAVERMIGDGIGGLNSDVARCIRQLQFTVNQTAAPQFDLVMTGATSNGTTSGDIDAYILTLSPGNLKPAGIGKRYGFSGSVIDAELGWSVAPVPAVGNLTSGFIMAGLTTSNPEGAVPPDPGDLYLVKTDGLGDVEGECDYAYNPSDSLIFWYRTNPLSGPTPIASVALPVTPKTDRDWGNGVCATRNKPGVSPAIGGRSTISSDAGISASYPNPVRRGTPLSIDFTPSGKDRIQLFVIDARSEIVARMTVANPGHATTLHVGTETLPAGSYVINVSDGNGTSVTRAVVID